MREQSPRRKKQTKAKQARVAPLYGELRAWFEMAYVSSRFGMSFYRFLEGAGYLGIEDGLA